MIFTARIISQRQTTERKGVAVMRMYDVEVYISDGDVFIQQGSENAIRLSVDQCEVVSEWIAEAAKSGIKNHAIQSVTSKE